METHSKAGAGIGRHPLFRKELKRRVSTCFSSLCCVFAPPMDGIVISGAISALAINGSSLGSGLMQAVKETAASGRLRNATQRRKTRRKGGFHVAEASRTRKPEDPAGWGFRWSEVPGFPRFRGSGGPGFPRGPELSRGACVCACSSPAESTGGVSRERVTCQR